MRAGIPLKYTFRCRFTYIWCSVGSHSPRLGAPSARNSPIRKVIEGSLKQRANVGEFPEASLKLHYSHAIVQ
jgi:hypothetical protein